MSLLTGCRDVKFYVSLQLRTKQTFEHILIPDALKRYYERLKSIRLTIKFDGALQHYQTYL